MLLKDLSMVIRVKWLRSLTTLFLDVFASVFSLNHEKLVVTLELS